MSPKEIERQSDGEVAKRRLEDVLNTDNEASSSAKRQNVNSDGKENDAIEDDNRQEMSINPGNTAMATSAQDPIIAEKKGDKEIVMSSSSKPGCVSVQSMTASTTQNNHNAAEDSPMVVKSNLTNPMIQYIHSRVDCGVYNFETTNKLNYCPKCYCVVCEIEASRCTNWRSHCKERPKLKPTTDHDEVTVLGSNSNNLNYNEQLGEFMRTQGYVMMDRDLARLLGRKDRFGTRRYYDNSDEEDGGASVRRKKSPSQLRITDVLSQKLNEVIEESEGQAAGGAGALASLISSSDGNVRTTDPPISKLAMEGDISQLRLHNSFFVEGVKIGWPFSTILQPQRLMAVHIVKALKRSLHCVLESPTGTGK